MFQVVDLDQGESFLLIASLKHFIAVVNIQMYISSVIVHASPDHIEETRSQLLSLEGVEIHAAEANGKLIVTLDMEDEKSTTDTFEQVNRVVGVMSASMVYHHFEPETDPK